ncbi:hypothetical protein AeMF1_001047 [Aphanomyces euteiches]|nr:hypothetical protein AeMF1_001047 [Aphanomyces euteiches]
MSEATKSKEGEGVFRLHPDPFVRKYVPSYVADFLELVLAVIAIHYLLWFWLAGFILYYFHAIGYTYVSVALLVLYLPVYFNKAHLKLTAGEGSMSWDAFRTSSLWKMLCSYMGVELIREAELDSAKQYVFGYHPHGILILSRVSTYAGNFEKLFPGIDSRTLAATPMFYVPMSRELSLALTAVDASRKNAERILQKKFSVIVYPGGSKEIFLTDPNSKETTLVLNDRLGFIKLAVRHGAELVPTFVFGEKWMYNIWNPPQSVRSFFLKTLKVPLLLFWGRCFTWLPLRLTGKRKFGVVFGKPIPVDKKEDPTDEELTKLHALYVERLKEIFEKYKAEFGYDDDETLNIK